MFSKNKKLSSGFTIIEMLISVVVIGVLTSVGVARFRTFNEKQEVSVAAKDTMEVLRNTQKKAKAGEKPTGPFECDETLNGYRVIMEAGTGTLTVAAVCTDGVFGESSVNLTTDSVFYTREEVFFQVVTGGATGAIITLADRVSNPNYQYQVEVTDSGSINDLGAIE